MATASAVTVRRGNDQFRGLFSDTWVVRDMVSGSSLGVDLVGLTVTGYVSAANTVKFRIQNESGSTADLASSTLRVVVARMV
jgi:putative N-acetylmannosamine-6-phosphate epimerase